MIPRKKKAPEGAEKLTPLRRAGGMRIELYRSTTGGQARARTSSNSLTIGLLHNFFAVSVSHLFNRPGAKEARGHKKGQAKWRGVK
jgi:hypothetical protein